MRSITVTADKDNIAGSNVSYNFEIKESPVEEEKKSFKILIVGDTMLARSIGDKIKAGDNPFKYVKDKFAEYDLVVANLECVISDKGVAARGKSYTFQAPVSSIQLIEENGIDVVSLANNHTMDFGAEALTDMLSRLSNSNIKHFGAGNNLEEAYTPLIINKNNLKIAFVGFNGVQNNYTNVKPTSPGSAYFDTVLMKKSIMQAQEEADIVIPYVHWGIDFVLPVSSSQKSFARVMLDSGADIVVGNHPHLIQASENVNGRMVYYSLGNFVFDLMYNDAAISDMLEINIEDKRIISTKVIKTKINKEGFPELMK